MNGIEDYLLRDWHMLVGREHGPLSFRMVLQPLVAAALAIRPGLQDARGGRRPFGWTLVTEASERNALMREGWKDVRRLFVVAVAMDVIYQIIVFHTVYPIQALVVAAILAIPTYVFTRGLTNRIARWADARGGTSR
jgi:hypothetical protein